MVDDLLSGRVTSFRREQGFGVITLDDGRDVKFDASACTMVPEEGASVRLRVGPAKWGGGIKALHVEPRGSSTLFIPADPPSLDQQIAALQREHLVAGLSEQIMAELTAEAFGGDLDSVTLLDVMDAYYVQDSARARHDGYLRRVRPYRPGGSDIFADIAALLPGTAVPQALSWAPADASDGGVLGTHTLQLPDGSERTLPVESLDDLVMVVNEVLRSGGDPRRMYPLDTASDWHGYLVLPVDRAVRLAAHLPFAIRPQDVD